MIKYFAHLIVLPTVVCVALGTARAEERRKVFILPPKVIGLPPATEALLSSKLAETLGKRSELQVITQADLQEVTSLDKTKQLLGCNEDSGCMARIADAANADLIISSSIGRVGGAIVMSLTLIDPKKGAPINQVSETLERSEAVSDEAPRSLARLFGWKGAVEKAHFKLPKGGKLSFALFELKATGLSEEAAQNLTQVLATEIKRVEGASVISKDDIAALLSHDKMKSLLGAACDTSCVAEIGGALGVDKLIVGQVGKLADSYVVSLRLIDPNQVKVDNRVTESYQGKEENLIRAVRFAGRELLGIEAASKGAVAVSASQANASVFLDDKPVGELPLPPVTGLPDGRHRISVVKDGFYDWQSDTYVDPGDTTPVWAELSERPEKWYQKWWVWTIVGVAAAAGGTAAVLATASSPSNGSAEVVVP